MWSARHPGCVPAVMLRRQLEELVAVYPTAKLWQMQVRHCHGMPCVGGGTLFAEADSVRVGSSLQHSRTVARSCPLYLKVNSWIYFQKFLNP